jgi:hypothetical protein
MKNLIFISAILLTSCANKTYYFPETFDEAEVYADSLFHVELPQQGQYYVSDVDSKKDSTTNSADLVLPHHKK